MGVDDQRRSTTDEGRDHGASHVTSSTLAGYDNEHAGKDGYDGEHGTLNGARAVGFGAPDRRLKRHEKADMILWT